MNDNRTEIKDIIEIKERLVKIEVLLSEKISVLESRVASMENNQKWMSRLIISSVITTVLALIGLQV